MTRNDYERMLTNIRDSADEQNVDFPQYRGHWSGLEWILVRVTRTIKTKLGVAFSPGTIAIGRIDPIVEPDGKVIRGWTVYSLLNRCNTFVRLSDVDVVTLVDGC